MCWTAGLRSAARATANKEIFTTEAPEHLQQAPGTDAGTVLED